MTPTPHISIILPVRNAEETLEACLESLYLQTWTDWECLAIDDHSTDRSREILEAHFRSDERIRLLEAPDPGGLVNALEVGRRRALAPILARQDADDISLPWRLVRQLEVMNEYEDLAVVGCLTQTDREPTDGMRRYLDWLASCTTPEVCAREIWVESPIAHPTAMIRAAVLDEVGGYRDMSWPEDYDLWLRINRAGYKITNVSDTLYEWSDRPDRLSRTDPRYSPEAFLRCRVHHLRRWLSEQGNERPLIVWGAGRDGKLLVRAWDAEATLPGPPTNQIVGLIDIDPRKIGRDRGGRPVMTLAEARSRFSDAFYLAAVGVEGARDLIRTSLTAEGLSEVTDFVCLH